MKVAIIGYGKMGKMLHKCALEDHHEVIAVIGKDNWDDEKILKADICFEFSDPMSVLDNVEKIARLKKNVVIGTTGWYEHEDFLKQLLKETETGAIFSPNFSIGVQLFFKIVEYSSSLISKFDLYDIAAIEKHHKQKLDAPSGTAHILSSILRFTTGKEVEFNSVRCGFIPGTHSILFDSSVDTITLTHEARNREGFAKGALTAGKWLIGKKGLFTLEDCINDILGENL